MIPQFPGAVLHRQCKGTVRPERLQLEGEEHLASGKCFQVGMQSAATALLVWGVELSAELPYPLYKSLFIFTVTFVSSFLTDHYLHERFPLLFYFLLSLGSSLVWGSAWGWGWHSAATQHRV